MNTTVSHETTYFSSSFEISDASRGIVKLINMLNFRLML